jgi:uncharacterized membrane protein
LIFTYFLRYITQSVKYDVLIKRIYYNTFEVSSKKCLRKEKIHTEIIVDEKEIVAGVKSGIFKNINYDAILKICEENNFMKKLIHVLRNFILAYTPIALVCKSLDETTTKNIQSFNSINGTETIDENYYYGFEQITKVAIKSISPSINDPSSAVISLRSLFKLCSFRINNYTD